MSKLDEMRNQFRERLSIRPVGQNRITILKVDNDFNNNNNNNNNNNSSIRTKSMNTSKNSNLFATKIIPKMNENYEKKTSIIPSKVSDNRNAIKPLSRSSVEPKTRSFANTTSNRESTRFMPNIRKTSTKFNRFIGNNTNPEFKPIIGFEKEIETKNQRMTSMPIKSRISSPKDIRNRMSSREGKEGREGSEGTPCRFCGRFFAISERLQKHETVCNSSLSNCRQKFDSVKQRFKGQPKDYLQIYENALNNPYEEEKKRWNWRQKHEYCIAAIRSARGQPSDGPSTSQIMASTQQQCDYCKRRFSDEAIKRHLPICAKLFRKKVDQF